MELSDNKSPQVSRIIFNIRADLNYAVVWMVSTCPFISKSSSPFMDPFVLLLLLLLTYLLTPQEFFTSVLADGFSLESEWQ